MHRRCSGLPSAARIGAALICFGLLLLAGCGGGDPRKRVTVTGKVTLDGQPLTGGAVYFHPVLEKGANLPPSASVPSVCELGDDGSFTLRTGGNPGAPVGKYRVQVEPGDKSDREQWARVPRAYRKSNSPLQVEVVENKPEGYDLQLSSKEKPKKSAAELRKERDRSITEKNKQ